MVPEGKLSNKSARTCNSFEYLEFNRKNVYRTFKIILYAAEVEFSSFLKEKKKKKLTNAF